MTAVGQAQDTAATEKDGSAPTVMPSRDALKMMSGMAGYYRASPTGDVYLYPRIKLVEGMSGMYGTYRVTPEGIQLHPGGAQGMTMAESAMGGASGTFRITPSGQAYFYPYQEPQGANASGAE
jgi:hypothetical protein